MTQPTIHLGYEVGTGEPVAIPTRNLAVTGQTHYDLVPSKRALAVRCGAVEATRRDVVDRVRANIGGPLAIGARSGSAEPRNSPSFRRC